MIDRNEFCGETPGWRDRFFGKRSREPESVPARALLILVLEARHERTNNALAAKGLAGTIDRIESFRSTEAPAVGKTGRPDPARVSQTHPPRPGKTPRKALIHGLASSVLYQVSLIMMNRAYTNDPLWISLVDQFREACVLRRNGRHDESEHLLQTELPNKIAAWSKQPMPVGTDRRNALETMFQEEQRRVEEAFFVQKLVATQIEEQLLPKLCFMIAEEIRDVVRAEAQAGKGLVETLSRRRTQSPARPRVQFDDVSSEDESQLQAA